MTFIKRVRWSHSKEFGKLEVGGFGKLGKVPDPPIHLKKRVLARQQIHARSSRQTSAQISSCLPRTQTRSPAHVFGSESSHGVFAKKIRLSVGGRCNPKIYTRMTLNAEYTRVRNAQARHAPHLAPCSADGQP
jgi:hypothetical protein